jgi:Lar family restriction alleviation protein
MHDSQELRECPFCGGVADVLVYDEHATNVYCKECGAQAGSAYTKAEAATNWNSRAERDAVIERMAQMAQDEGQRIKSFAGPMAVAACETLAEKYRAMKERL